MFLTDNLKNFFANYYLGLAVIALSVGLLSYTIFFSISNPDIWYVSVSPAVLLITTGVFSFFYCSRKNRNYIKLAAEISGNAERSAVHSIPSSVAIIDKNFKIIWFNDVFKEIFSEYAVYGTSISLLWGGQNKSRQINYKEKIYDISVKENTDEEFCTHTLFFTDITEKVTALAKLNETKPVVMLISIDSFDEDFFEIPESERAAVAMKLDKLLENFVGNPQNNAVMRKYGKNKVFIVLEKRSVDRAVSDKMPLLDHAREIKIETVNSRTNLTLSIGIGTTGETLAESEVFAKNALEMAMGRGGDQAAIKTAEGFEFFGGISKPVEKRTKVRVRHIVNSLRGLLEGSDTVFITGHRNSDFDSIGACVALSAVVRNMGKPVYTIVDKLNSNGKELIERVEFDFEYREREKLRVLKENSSSPPISRREITSFFTAPNAVAKLNITKDSLLIICDTQNIKLLEDPELLFRFQKTVIIDHHLKMVNFIGNSTLFYHEPTASSACEMVAELIQYFDRFNTLTPVQAEAALSGIMLDTKNFTVKTGVRTFEAAAFLKTKGADAAEVKRFFENTFDTYRKKCDFLENAKIYPANTKPEPEKNNRNSHSGYAVASSDKLDPEYKIIAPQTADELLNLKDIEASFVLFRSSENEVSVCARSRGGINNTNVMVNVQVIMEKLGGGGHQTMAGAQFEGKSAVNALPMLINAIDDCI